ncbi:MAG: helix-turn-helix domain-containing protein [Oscillospiraceae bacterium]
MDQTRTGALIRALRQNKQLTQRQLADAIGVSDKAVSKWERGCGAPDISLLPRRTGSGHECRGAAPGRSGGK